MATDLIVWAWAVFVLRTVLSEVPEGLGPVSGSTGGYGPDSLNSTSGEAADSSSHEPKPHQSLSLHKPETLGNPDVQWILANPLSSRRVPFGSKYGHKVLGSSQEGRGDSNTAVPPSYSSALPSNPGGMVVHPSSSTKFPQGQSYQSSAFNVIQPTNSKLFQNKDAPSMGQDAPNPSEPGSQDAPNPSEPGRPDAPGAGSDASSMGQDAPSLSEPGSQDAPNPSEPGSQDATGIDAPSMGQDAPNPSEPGSQDATGPDAPSMGQDAPNPSEPGRQDAPGAGQDASSMGRVNDRVLRRFPEQFLSQKTQNTVYRWPVSSIQLQSQHSGAVQTEQIQARPQTNDRVLQRFPERFTSQKPVDVMQLNEPNSKFFQNKDELDQETIQSSEMHEPDASTVYRWPVSSIQLQSQHSGAVQTEQIQAGPQTNDRVLQRFPERFISQKPVDVMQLNEPNSKFFQNKDELDQETIQSSEMHEPDASTVYRWPVSSIQLQSQHSGAVQTEQIQAGPQTNDRVLQRFPERFISQKPVDVMQLNEPNSKFFQNKDELDQEPIQSSEMHEPDASTAYRWPVSSIQLQSQHSGAVQTERRPSIGADFQARPQYFAPSEPGRPDAPGAGQDASSMGRVNDRVLRRFPEQFLSQKTQNTVYRWPVSSIQLQSQHSGAVQTEQIQARPQTNDRVLQRFPERFTSQKPVDVMQLNEPNSKFFQNKDELDQETIQSSEMHEPDASTVYRWPVSSIQLQSQHSGAVQTEQIQAGPQTNDRVLQRFPERFISQKPVDVMQLNEPNSKFFQNKDELDQEPIQSSEMHEPDASTAYRWPVSSIQLQSQHSGAVQTERRPSIGADFQARPQYFAPSEPGRPDAPGAGSDASSMGQDAPSLSEPGSQDAPNPSEPGSQDATGIDAPSMGQDAPNPSEPGSQDATGLDAPSMGQDAPNPSEPGSQDATGPDAPSMGQDAPNPSEPGRQDAPGAGQDASSMGRVNDRVLRRFPEQFLSQKTQNTVYRWPVSSIQLQSQHSGAVQTEQIQARPQTNDRVLQRFPERFISQKPVDVMQLNEPNSKFFQNKDELDQEPIQSSEMHEPDASTVYRWPVSSIQLQSQHSGAVQTEQIQAGPQTNDRVLQRFPERFISQKPVDVMQLNEPNSKFFQNKDELDQEPIQSSEMHEPDASTAYRWPVSSIQLQSQHSGAVQTERRPSIGAHFQARPQYFAPSPSEPGRPDAPNPSEPSRPDAPGAGPDASSMGRVNDRVLQRFPEPFISQKTQNAVYRWPVSNIQLQSQHSGAVQTERRPSIGAHFQARPQTNDRVLQSFPEQYTNQKTVDVIKVLNEPNSESLYGSKTSQEAKQASNVLHQKEQGSQQPIQSTDTTVSHGVQMLEPSKTNPVQSPNEFYSEPDPQFGSEGTIRPGSQSAATATEILGTTSGYLSPHEPKYQLPAQTSSSYSYGTSGQLANKGDPVPSGSHGPIRSQGGVEGRQPSGEQNLPSRVDALNRLKQALHNVSRGHLFHSVMQRLIPASSPSWNMGEGWDFLGSAENSPSLTGDQSHFGDDGNDLSTSVSRGETSSSKSSISHAPENVGSGKSDGGVMSPSPLVNVYGSGSSSALSNAVSSHRGNDGSARKGTTIQQTTKEAPKGPLQMSAACLTRKVIPAQRRIPAKSFYRKMSAVKPAKHHWPLLTPKRFRKLRVLEGKCEGAAHKL
ncbi:uncharacterized protein LOC116224439 isoform X4 [Clupea harengus]|uniref:Uncharacterized protein LOC116224439 isoform X4 n=1 Tax=Clupea harengus TaxID=7950 RepID=A0A6P8GX41_CLUHA|nr:uncharacterized protein LOC116224439 isoform X4 [Clupea harengus]